MLLQIKQEKCFSRVRWYQAVVCVSLRFLILWSMIVMMACQDSGEVTIVTDREVEAETLTSVLPEETNSQSATDPGIYVHVCGRVTSPGVYLLSEGSRVWDAVEAAGGFLPEAASHAINLAMIVDDGSKITIPDETEADEDGFRWYETDGGRSLTIGGTAVGGSYDRGQEIAGIWDGVYDGRVDINRADVTALMTIPGIGQTRAEAIVSFRESRGPFENIEEIMLVTGIKEGLFAKIKEYITVGG